MHPDIKLFSSHLPLLQTLGGWGRRQFHAVSPGVRVSFALRRLMVENALAAGCAGDHLLRRASDAVTHAN